MCYLDAYRADEAKAVAANQRVGPVGSVLRPHKGRLLEDEVFLGKVLHGKSTFNGEYVTSM